LKVIWPYISTNSEENKLLIQIIGFFQKKFNLIFHFVIPPSQALPCGEYGGGSEPINQWAHIWMSNTKPLPDEIANAKHTSDNEKRH
jgi:hypothetical protein